MGVPNTLTLAAALIVSKCKNTILLDAINRIVWNVDNKYYGINSLCPTGPCVLGSSYTKYSRNKQFRLSYEDLTMYLDKIPIMTIYPNYRNELKMQPGFVHYHDAWIMKRIYRERFQALDKFVILNFVNRIQLDEYCHIKNLSLMKLSNNNFLLLKQYNNDQNKFSKTILSYDMKIIVPETFYNNIFDNIISFQLYSYNGNINILLIDNIEKIHINIGIVDINSDKLNLQRISNNLKKFDDRFINNVYPSLTTFGNSLCVISSFYPLHVTSIYDNSLVPIYTNPHIPDTFQHVISSTPIIEYKDIYWAVVKERYIKEEFLSEKEQEDNYHRFIVLDSNMNILRYSMPFKFNKSSNIETCQGIIINNNKCLLTCMTSGSFYIFEYNYDYINEITNIMGPPTI